MKNHFFIFFTFLVLFIAACSSEGESNDEGVAIVEAIPTETAIPNQDETISEPTSIPEPTPATEPTEEPVVVAPILRSSETNSDNGVS